MDAQISPAANSKRVLEIGIWQWIAISFTVILGGMIAYNKNMWWTFGGAAAGIVLSILITQGAHLILRNRIVKFIFAQFAYSVEQLATVVASNTLKTEGYLIYTRMTELWGILWGILVGQSPQTAARLIVGGACKSPIKYLSWFTIGMIVQVILTAQNSGGLTILNGIPLELDLPLGIFILLAVLRDTLQDSERDALAKAEQIVPNVISDRLLSLWRIPGKTHFESGEYIAELRQEMRKNSWRVGKFTANGVSFLEGCFNLFVLLLVLFWISPLGSLLACFAVLSMIPIRFADLLSVKSAEDDTIIARAELNGAQRIAEDNRMQGLLNFIANPGVFAAFISGKRQYVASVRESMRVAGGQRRAAARMVFFTMFALSALAPVEAACKGELQARVAMLYFFSLLGLWGALSSAADRASRLVENLDDLEKVEEALKLLYLETPTSSSDQASSLSASEQLSTTIGFVETRFNYPFRPQLLRVVGKVTVGATISTARVVKVLGAPRSGTSTLLRLMAGQVKPNLEDEKNAQSIQIGGVSTVAYDMAPWVLLIPEDFPDFSGIKIGELFRAIVGPELLDRDIEQTLDRFGLLKEIKVDGDSFSGVELLIGSKERPLTVEQRHLLFLALNYAALESRLSDRGSFNPAVVAVDGIAKLSTVQRRRDVAALFKNLCDELHSTFVCVVRHKGEIDDSDYVLSIISPEDLPPDFQNHGNSNVVVGGVHQDRWNCPDEVRQKRYRLWLKTQGERF